MTPQSQKVVSTLDPRDNRNLWDRNHEEWKVSAYSLDEMEAEGLRKDDFGKCEIWFEVGSE